MGTADKITPIRQAALEVLRHNLNGPCDDHNGGVWPFVCGFYVAARVAAGRHRLAARKLEALCALVTPARDHPDLEFGFNEWFRTQDGTPQGEDWQTWSAAMVLYAAACVEERRVLLLDDPFAQG